MGSNEDELYAYPAHEVRVGSFVLAEAEVTNELWIRVMDPGSLSAVPADERNLPKTGVSWDECQEFISKLNSIAGGAPYRLPTEAEWCYVARPMAGLKGVGCSWLGSRGLKAGSCEAEWSLVAESPVRM